MIVLWQTRGCEKHPKRGEGFRAGMRTERGRECEKERDRERKADREHGTQGSLLLCDWAKSWSGTRREKGENPHFHMCANVLSGTLPGSLLIWNPASVFSKSVPVPHSASLTDLCHSPDQCLSACLGDYCAFGIRNWETSYPLSSLNDYWPMALTPVTTKCFERLVQQFILACLLPTFDPHKFS